jgi:amidase
MESALKTAEYAALDATALAALIARGEVTAAEAETAARAAVAAVNGDLNALARPLFDPALGSEPGGVLAGVPFLIKDSAPFARNVPFALGSRSVRGAVAPADHPMMSRFRAAGLVTIGQTTAPEYSLSFATESRRYGVTRNPWALDRGVGGSSGGAAALVAAGAVPVAHGNDGAGSLRIPASACGLVGLKPSRGRTPGTERQPGLGLPLGGEFVLTRTVRDAALMLDAVGDQWPADAGTHLSGTRRDPGALRVAVTTAAFSGVAVDPQVAAAAVAAAGTLEWIGHRVVERSPAVETERVLDALVLEAVAVGRAVLAAPRRPFAEELEAVSRRLLSETLGFPAARARASAASQLAVTRSIAGFFEEVDILVTPTLGALPARHGFLDYDDPWFDSADSSVRDWMRRITDYGPFTAPFNVSGHPAISLPLGESVEGLPIGVQLVAAAGAEGLLLSVAAQLEQAMPWAQRQPPIWAG